MSNHLREAWEKYILEIQTNANNDSELYRYPVTDHSTDSKIEKQDSEKCNTEQSFISQILNWDWEVAIDFGCGTGANFPFFDQPETKDSIMIGIDPDCSRARIAQERAAREFTQLKSYVVCGDIGVLENALSDLSADMVLCAQVLGHVSTNQMKRILEGFHKILRPRGVCGVLIPIVGESFKDDPDSGEWNGTSDYTHLVDISLSPGDVNFRTHVSLDEYNKAANRPTRNILPVRSFLVNEFPDPTITSTPHEMKEIPKSVSAITHTLFEVERVILYSIHRNSPDSTAPIGDLMIHFRKH